MDKPTEEQIKKFWEKFGFKYEYAVEPFAARWWIIKYPDGSHGNCLKKAINPSIDLNNLFKYAKQATITKIARVWKTDEKSAQRTLFKWWMEKIEIGLSDEIALFETMNDVAQLKED